MGLKENFTPDEWENLVRLPFAISMTVIVAAPSVLGAWGEAKAMISEPPKLAAASGSALAGMISAEMQARSKELVKEQEHAVRQDQAGYRMRTLGSCRAAAAALEKVPPEEALAFKTWVLAIGQKVAEAAKEHGVAVSEPEKAALTEISGALGISG
jgi:hypothetical protein